MRFLEYLIRAGVPGHLHQVAIGALEDARQRAKGLTWAKWRVRIFKAGKIADMLPWDAERLIDLRPDLAAWDIAPMTNITAHGDNVPWVSTPDGWRPAPGRWLNEDPVSDEYQQAVAACYWCDGEHPRSKTARKAWYRRNAGEHEAWARGKSVNVMNARAWHGPGVVVYECDGAWQINAADKWLGVVPVKVRIGYEISNVWRESDGAQLWFPIPGKDLRAPVTWSILPGRGDR